MQQSINIENKIEENNAAPSESVEGTENSLKNLESQGNDEVYGSITQSSGDIKTPEEDLENPIFNNAQIEPFESSLNSISKSIEIIEKLLQNPNFTGNDEVGAIPNFLDTIQNSLKNLEQNLKFTGNDEVDAFSCFSRQKSDDYTIQKPEEYLKNAIANQIQRLFLSINKDNT